MGSNPAFQFKFGETSDRHPSFLVIEDNKAFRMIVKNILHKIGDVIYEAEDVPEGLELLRKHKPDIVIIDLYLPSMSGHEVLSIMKREFPLTPALILSGTDKIDDVVMSLKKGAWDYVRKPIDDHNLFINIIHKCLYKSMLMNDKESYRTRLETDVRNRTRELMEINSRLEGEIEERKRIESELQRAKETAEAANRTKTEFLANMSHEIRTPLNGIMGMLQLMQTTRLNEEQRDFLSEALRSSERLAGLLSDILDISRIEAGKVRFFEKDFNLLSLKKSLNDLFTLNARMNNLELEISFSKDIPHVLVGDEMRLRQILFNLLGNAIKFTHKGKVGLEIYPLQFGENNVLKLLFIVRDTGIGIKDEMLKQIFEPFVQAESSYNRRYEGAGLGLSIVRKLTELLKGCLCIESFENEGTNVYISLQFKYKQQTNEENPNKFITSVELTKTKYHVLLAEDDMVNSKLLRRMLERLGLQVTAVTNGQDVLMLHANNDFDLILMDIQMPVLNGVEATRAIRKAQTSGRKSEIPIIAITAYASEKDKDVFLSEGMNGYIPKPIDFRILTDVIMSILPRQ